MNTKYSFVINSTYSISAYNKQGVRVYLSTDSYSGGYPFWTALESSRDEYLDVEAVPVINKTDPLFKEVTSITVLKISVVAEVVDVTDMIAEARKKVEAEINQLRHELNEKTVYLESLYNT